MLTTILQRKLFLLQLQPLNVCDKLHPCFQQCPAGGGHPKPFLKIYETPRLVRSRSSRDGPTPNLLDLRETSRPILKDSPAPDTRLAVSVYFLLFHLVPRHGCKGVILVLLAGKLKSRPPYNPRHDVPPRGHSSRTRRSTRHSCALCL